jgi:DNA-binding MarR family transcriptional regulator
MDPTETGSKVMAALSPATLRKFADAAQSLKLYRRAELLDANSDKSLIDKLYVDPLQNDAILEAMLRPNTTFIVGRKGTGKSTVFQRAQYEIRQSKRLLSAYVDIKTVFESAEVDPEVTSQLGEGALPDHELKRVLLYRAFTRAVFLEIQKELRAQVTSSLFERVKESLGANRNEVVEALDELLEGSFEADVADVTAAVSTSVKSKLETKDSAKRQTALDAKASASGAAGVSAEGSIGRQWEAASESASADEHQYSRILLRTFNINAIMEKMQRILTTIKVKHLYIFIDDFSELPKEAMEVLVDTVLAPLNNWANEFIKFKVAGYPDRIYFGKIDRTKMDEVYLDIYRMYGAGDVTSMEEKAIDFTRRLINSRLQHFVKEDFDAFCDGHVDAIYRHLFYATTGNARILGHVLHYLRESHLAYGRKIGVRAVQEAAAKYYEEKIEPFFGIQKFAHQSFEERSSIFSLKELLETMVERARELKSYKQSSVTRDIEGRTPSSHFHVLSDLDSLLSTLELNFFITKWFQMKDRDGRKVSVYALNYGLCGKYSLAFGRPEGKREYRLYYIERVFDYTPLLRRFLQKNQEIKCTGCGAVHGLDKWESIKLFDMMCPACKAGRCEVTNLSRKYEGMLRGMDSNLLLPPTELGILETLFVEHRDLAASEIAEELDCSYQLVGWRGKIMEERGLVLRKRNDQNRRVYGLTDHAVDEYFEDNRERRLDVSTEDLDASAEDVETDA